MFKFLKKMLGFDPETMKEAGVQLEQAPYKLEPPVLDKVAEVNATPIVKEAAPAAMKAPAKKQTKKPASTTAPAKKEGTKKPVGRGGRKPKTKAK